MLSTAKRFIEFGILLLSSASKLKLFFIIFNELINAFIKENT